MGGIESRFNTLLVEKKTVEAMHMWVENPDLQSSFRPNAPIKYSPTRDTPLHCAARGEMKILLHDFLERGGDPFVRNANGETPLHIVCCSARGSSRTSKKRAEILQLLLEEIPDACKMDTYDILGPGGETSGEHFERSGSLSGSPDSLNLGVQDRAHNTPLHLAAASGLLSCVEMLLAHGAPLFVQNVAGQTPCDVAAESKQLIIAKLLESKMVFTEELEEEPKPTRPVTRSRSKSYRINLKDLRKEIVDNVATVLNIAEFPAQALLMAYGWSEVLVVQHWEKNKEAACEKAGLDLRSILASGFSPASSPSSSLSLCQCEICFTDITPICKTTIPCRHNFCPECWKQYLDGQIREGAGKEIRCPGHGCMKIVPPEVVASLVPEDLFMKYSELNLKQFVDTYDDVKWCPYPDCGHAVSLQQHQGKGRGERRGGAKPLPVGKREGTKEGTGLNIECGRGHAFCWNCMQEAHEPCNCDLWRQWKDVIQKMGEVDGDQAKTVAEAAANAQWIMRFTKPCPHCSAPIQKNEGCNHITCKKCRYDFCWVCLDPWSLHDHRTGGYFTCNRYKAQQNAEQTVTKARRNLEREYIAVAEEKSKEKREKFQHYYDRYSNHLNSIEIERKLLEESKAKAEELAKMGQVLEKKVAKVRAQSLLTSQECGVTLVMNSEENFLEDVIRVLLHARRILSTSYCLGYFIPDNRKTVINAYETLQGKLEDAVERLSQMVNRPYLLTPHSKMSEAARDVNFLCEEYLTEMREVAVVAYDARKEALQQQQQKQQEEQEIAATARQRQRQQASPLRFLLRGASPPRLNRPPTPIPAARNRRFNSSFELTL